MNRNTDRRPPVTGKKGGRDYSQRKFSTERKSYASGSHNENEDRGYRGRPKFGDRKEGFGHKTGPSTRGSFSERDRFNKRNGFTQRDGFAKRDNFGRKENFGERDRFNKKDDFAKRDGFAKRDSFGRKENFGERGRFNKKDDFAKRETSERRDGYRTTGKTYRPSDKKYTYKERVHRVRPITEQPLDNTSMRLNKFIANSGVCSRREADTFISTGLVTVNGTIVTELGIKIDPSKDEIRFNGERLKGENNVYIVMNKPKNFVTTLSDPHTEKTVMDLISKEKCKERVVPVGRLDKTTLGVLMFTNDGQMIEKLTHPSFRVKKIYHVFLDKNLKKNDFDAILKGIDLEDGEIHADSLAYVENDMSQIGIEIHSGRNRIVRRIFEHLGYKVKKLDRVYFAGLTKKNLKRGEWRFLQQEEINMLKMGAWQ